MGKTFNISANDNLKIINEKWVDEKTYIVIFNYMQDSSNGEIYHFEVEYCKDNDNLTFFCTYKNERIPLSMAHISIKSLLMRAKRQIREYVLRQVGVVRENSILQRHCINVTLELDIPQDLSINEVKEYLNSLKVEIVHTMSPRDEKIKIISVTNDGECY